MYSIALKVIRYDSQLLSLARRGGLLTQPIAVTLIVTESVCCSFILCIYPLRDRLPPPPQLHTVGPYQHVQPDSFMTIIY